MRKGQIILLTAALLAAIGGLYLLNRYWVASAKVEYVTPFSNHPVAPDFTVTDFSGEKIRLSDLRGKVVLLDFWATWCGPCRSEIPSFEQFQNRYGSRGLRVLGIVTQDNPQNVPAFYRQFRMNYPVAMGNDRLENLYGGIYGLPTTFLIGRDGRIYSRAEGTVDLAHFEREIQKLLAQ